MVDWGRFKDILLRGGHDRIVLLTTVLSVFIVPIHWAVLIGLAVSIAIFLRRVSQLRLAEMVSGETGQFHEHAVDDQTGKSVITMLQIEGPLFFAHADELAQMLRGIARHAPRVIIVRMRRTQQIDFSVITALNAVVEDYRAAGGALIICGLTPEMRAALRHSPLGRTVPAKYLLKTTRKVFGSAHTAIKLAESLVPPDARGERRLFRSAAALAGD
jgi:SulP family sulfate permease